MKQVRYGFAIATLGAAICVLTSCAYSYYEPVLKVGLVQVDRSDDGSGESGAGAGHHLDSLPSGPADSRVFDDDRIRVIWDIDKCQIYMEFLNRTEGNITVRWDDMYFEDTDGVSHKVQPKSVLHAGETVSETLVAPYALIKEIIQPVDYIHYLNGTSGAYSEECLFETSPSFFEGVNEKTKLNVGKALGVFLPMRIEGRNKGYFFRFRVISIEVERHECRSLDC